MIWSNGDQATVRKHMDNISWWQVFIANIRGRKEQPDINVNSFKVNFNFYWIGAHLDHWTYLVVNSTSGIFIHFNLVCNKINITWQFSGVIIVLYLIIAYIMVRTWGFPNAGFFEKLRHHLRFWDVFLEELFVEYPNKCIVINLMQRKQRIT